jgi:hypothetical protein
MRYLRFNHIRNGCHAGIVSFLVLLSCFPAAGQKKNCKIGHCFESLPATLQLMEDEPQRYQVTSTYSNRDIHGKFLSKNRITGIYTRGLGNNLVKWNEVKMVEIYTEDGTTSIKGKGRSHYWGIIWVSLEDKQVEHALLFEDVIMDMTITNMPPLLSNTTRILVVEKMK